MINKELVALIAFFIIVTLNHWIFISLAKSQRKKRKKLWNVHLIINGVLWLFLFVWIVKVQFRYSDFQALLWIRIIGGLSFLLGFLLVTISFKKIGFKRAMGWRFFTNDNINWFSSGIYSKLSNPMYDGFILILVGLWLFLGITADLFIALASYLLLNIFLASSENKRE